MLAHFPKYTLRRTLYLKLPDLKVRVSILRIKLPIQSILYPFQWLKICLKLINLEFGQEVCSEHIFMFPFLDKGLQKRGCLELLSDPPVKIVTLNLTWFQEFSTQDGQEFYRIIPPLTYGQKLEWEFSYRYLYASEPRLQKSFLYLLVSRMEHGVNTYCIKAA